MRVKDKSVIVTGASGGWTYRASSPLGRFPTALDVANAVL